jgi:transcriptional regulator with XRE-family HTH domain
MANQPAFTQPTPSSVAKRIRALRKSRGLTLQDIERMSTGSIKSVVMGSYERGARAISLSRALELANLFQIPIAELLQEPQPRFNSATEIARFDQRRISKLSEQEKDERFSTLYRFTIAISHRRGDWNGEILTIRKTDLDNLTLVLSMKLPEMTEWFKSWKIVLG